MYKVGVIGPKVSVERILAIAEDFSPQLVFSPLIYETATETPEIVLAHYDKYDFLLFSGLIPYDLAERVVKDTSKLFYIDSLETGFYKGLLDLTYHIQKMVGKLSIDILNKTNIIEDAMDQLKIPINQIYVKTFEADSNYMELYEHHLALWQSGKIEGVLTCYPEVAELLKAESVAVELISSTRLETKQVLKRIEERAQVSYFMRTQIGVCMIDVDMSVFKVQAEQLSYDIQLGNLKMNEALLLLSREMNGSFFNIGDGKYMIFSSRGEMIDNIKIINNTIHRLALLWNRIVTAGIGFGDSALKAELHARKAIHMSLMENSDIILIDNDGQEIEMPKNQSSAFDKDVLKQLEEKDISVQAFNRLKEAIRRKKWRQFTSKDVALELKTSNRNAQ